MQNTNIKNQDRFRQKVIFDKLKGPAGTDLDYVCDVRGKGFIYAELKCDGTRITKGQQILAENLLKNCKLPSFFLLLNHSTEPTEDIIIGDAIVNTIWMSFGSGDYHKSTKSRGRPFKEVKPEIEKLIHDRAKGIR